MAYVYLHRKQTNNEVFYVGRGKIATDRDRYRRPYAKKSRTRQWHNTVKKYGYIVDIVHDNLTFEEANKLEVFYINRYGRRDLNKGSLVNLCDGGRGGENIAEDVRRKISKSKLGANNHMFGKKRTAETRAKQALKNIGELNPFFGKKHSKEIMDKIVAKQAEHQRERRRKTISIALSYKEIIMNYKPTEAMQKTGLSKACIFRYKKLIQLHDGNQP